MEELLGMCRLLHKLMYSVVVLARAPLCTEMLTAGKASFSQLYKYRGHGWPLWAAFPTVLLPPATETRSSSPCINCEVQEGA